MGVAVSVASLSSWTPSLAALGSPGPVAIALQGGEAEDISVLGEPGNMEHSSKQPQNACPRVERCTQPPRLPREFQTFVQLAGDHSPPSLFPEGMAWGLWGQEAGRGAAQPRSPALVGGAVPRALANVLALASESRGFGPRPASPASRRCVFEGGGCSWLPLRLRPLRMLLSLGVQRSTLLPAVGSSRFLPREACALAGTDAEPCREGPGPPAPTPRAGPWHVLSPCSMGAARGWPAASRCCPAASRCCVPSTRSELHDTEQKLSSESKGKDRETRWFSAGALDGLVCVRRAHPGYVICSF